MRGHFPYYFPTDCKKYGIKVKDAYDNKNN